MEEESSRLVGIVRPPSPLGVPLYRWEGQAYPSTKAPREGGGQGRERSALGRSKP
jgi:hypothetical protein